MKINPKILVYILMISTLAINTPLSLVGIVGEISQYFNISIAIVGLFISSFTFTIAICGLFIPLVFSKYERKHTFMFILGIFSICNFISIFVHNFYIALILRIIPAIAYPAFVAIALTFTEEIAPEGEKQSYITLILLGISIGSIIGLPITTFIGTTIGYQATITWIFAINFISFILIALLFPIQKGKEKSYEAPLSSLKSGNFLLASLGIILMPIGFCIVYSYMSYYLQTITHIYTYQLSAVLFVYGLVSIVGTWMGGKILMKKDKITLVVFQLVCIAMISILYFFGALTISAIILILILGFLDGMGYNLIQYIEACALPDTPELANGIFVSILNGGIAIGSATGGFLVNGFGIMSIFIGAIIPLFLATIILYYVVYGGKINLKYS